MATTFLSEKANRYLHKLCVEIPSRRVGSAGNRAATGWFAHTISAFGFATECPEFDCFDWSEDGVQLTAGDTAFTAFVSPYSLGCRFQAPLATVSTVEELEKATITGQILLMHGDIAKGQLMPKNFTFYNPDEHKRIIALLEAKQPQAIIAATSRDVEMVGSMYPFPLFEDGDFDIPSVYMTDTEGLRLAQFVGQEITLESRASRIPAKGCNVLARRGADRHHRVVLFAHIDARIGSPGAGDNASGVIALLLLAELLSEYRGTLGIEIVALNGEDYYSNPGEMQYLAMNAGKFGEILLGINLDDVGYHRGKVAYSLYDCPQGIASTIRDAFAPYQGIMEGEPWYQGDHGLFLMNGTPALAVTSELLAELMSEITHTPKDRPEMVDTAKLVDLALALRDLLQCLSQAAAR